MLFKESNKEYKFVLTELEKLYFEEGINKAFSYEVIEDLMPKINEFSFSDFIQYMLEESFDSLWIEFLIPLYFKFAEIPCLEIISLLESLSLKFHRIVLLVYLCKYLEIDGSLLLDKSNLQTKEKASLEYFLKENKAFLIKSQKESMRIEKYNRVSVNELRKSGEKITNCLLRLDKGFRIN